MGEVVAEQALKVLVLTVEFVSAVHVREEEGACKEILVQAKHKFSQQRQANVENATRYGLLYLQGGKNRAFSKMENRYEYGMVTKNN